VSFRKTAEGKVEKVVRSVRLQTIVRRVPLAVVERRAGWRKFGAAAVPGGEANITYPSFEEVKIEKPEAEDKSALQKMVEARAAAAAAEGGAGGGSMVVCRRCGGAHWTLSCPYKDVTAMGGGPAGGAGAGAGAGGPGGGPGGPGGGPGGPGPDRPRPAEAGGLGGGGGKYVAPRARDGAPGGADGPERVIPLEEMTQLRVSNLGEDADEDELRMLFTPFGRLDKIFLAKDRETGVPRGFAFVRYMRHDDAAAAMRAIDRLPYQNLILRVEWSKPSTNGPGGGPGARPQFLTGYGQKLAQDSTAAKGASYH